MGTIIKSGVVVTGTGSKKTDVKLDGGKITELGDNLAADGFEVVDAEGCLVFPGFIDPRVKFDLFNGFTTTADDLLSGTLAAVAGGTTCVVDTAVQRRGAGLREAYGEAVAKIAGGCGCDCALQMLVTDFACAEKDIGWCFENGITAFIADMGNERYRISDGDIERLLSAVSRRGGTLSVHCEDGAAIDALVAEAKKHGQTLVPFYPRCAPEHTEADAVQRVLDIAARVGAPINLIKVSAKPSVILIRRARKAGQKIYFETAPHYMILDELEYAKIGFGASKFVCSPPLRTSRDIKTLWDSANRSELDVIASDHCAYNFSTQKSLGATDYTKIPCGLPGVENRPSLIYNYGMLDACITEAQMVRMLAENPAKLYGLYPKKGAIQVGADADVVVWDRFEKGVISPRTQHIPVDYNPYENIWTQGGSREVFLRSERVVENRNLLSKQAGAAQKSALPVFYR